MRTSEGRWTVVAGLVGAIAISGCQREREAAPTADSGAARSTDPCAGPSATLTPGGVGAVKGGATVRALRGVCFVADTAISLGEGMTERAHRVRVGSGSLIALSTGTPDTSITRVVVRDSAYRTERGIGIGSTVGQLRQAHGRICASIGEGRVVVASAALPGLSFETSLGLADVPGGPRTLERDPAAIPDDATITAAWAYDGPTLCGGS